MVHAKNYESASTFVKVMQKKLWLCFSIHGAYDFILRQDRLNLRDRPWLVCGMPRLENISKRAGDN